MIACTSDDPTDSGIAVLDLSLVANGPDMRLTWYFLRLVNQRRQYWASIFLYLVLL